MSNTQSVKFTKSGVLIAALVTLAILIVTAVITYNYNTFVQQPLPTLDPTEPWTKPDLALLSYLSGTEIGLLALCIMLAVVTGIALLEFVPNTKYPVAKPVLIIINTVVLLLALSLLFANPSTNIWQHHGATPSDENIELIATQTADWAKARYNIDLKQNFSDKDIYDLSQTATDSNTNTKTVVNIKGDSVKALHKGTQMILVEPNNQDNPTELPVVAK